MKKSVVLSALCVGALTTTAFAYDLSVKGNLSETVDGSNNYFLSNSPSGFTAKSLSAATLDVLAQTPTTQYLLDTYFSYYKYFGPGASAAQPTWGTPAHANFSIDHVTQLDKYHLAASWNRVDVATTLLEQTGRATSHGSLDTYNLNGAVIRDLSRIDTVSLSAAASTASSTDPGFTPYLDVTSAVNWNHTLSPTTSWNNLVSFDWFSADNPQESQRLFWRLMTGLNSRLTHRLTVTGHVGWAFVNAWQNGSAQAVVAPPVAVISGFAPFVPLVGSANSLLWDAGLTYALAKVTQLSLFGAQAIAPSITGQLSKSESFGLTINHQINQSQSLTFFTQLAQTTSSQTGADFLAASATKSDFFTASLIYDWRLNRDWRTSLSYTYRQRNDDTGTATSSTVLLALNYDFNLMGNPAPINAALIQRERERAQNAVGYVFPMFH